MLATLLRLTTYSITHKITMSKAQMLLYIIFRFYSSEHALLKTVYILEEWWLKKKQLK